MEPRYFKNREQAAHLLVRRLREYRDKNPLVLGIPRGALPMASTIAAGLNGELDVVLVHKLTHRDQPELAIGAIDENGNAFFSGWAANLDASYLDAERERQLAVLKRRRAAYTPHRPPIDPHDRIVIVVDDGIATGSTMIAALRATRAAKPRKLICAAAVAPPHSARAMAAEADEVVCLATPPDFFAVGQFFEDFDQVTDEQVVKILSQAGTRAAATG